MKSLKLASLVALMALVLTSCLEEKPLQDDLPGTAVGLSGIQNAFVQATGGITPMEMGQDEWALFRISARLYTGSFQGLGYQAAQVLDAANEVLTLEGNSYNTRDLSVLVTDYDEPTGTEEPPISLQKEWKCRFITPPYFLWYSDCELPPEQNFWLFSGLEEPKENIFFSLAKYTKKEKLPAALIKEGRCYGFENCEIDVNYLEYDMIGKDANGDTQRVHYVTSFSGELPYLASNIKTCYNILLEVEGSKHPAEVCRELINFIPGKEPPPPNHN